MKILKIKELKNGNAILTYELTSKEIEMFATVAKSKGRRYSKKFVNEVILKVLKKLKSKYNGSLHQVERKSHSEMTLEKALNSLRLPKNTSYEANR